MDRKKQYFTLNFSDDTSVQCEALGTFHYKKEDYLVGFADSPEKAVYIYQYTKTRHGDYKLKNIKNEKVFHEICDYLKTLEIINE